MLNAKHLHSVSNYLHFIYHYTDQSQQIWEQEVKIHSQRNLNDVQLTATPLTQDPLMLRSSVHQSRVSVTMMYFGKTVHLSHNLNNIRDEVKVFQQHCGGENLCVYKGLIGEGGQCGDL